MIEHKHYTQGEKTIKRQKEQSQDKSKRPYANDKNTSRKLLLNRNSSKTLEELDKNEVTL